MRDRRTWIAVALTFVVAAVIGLIYLQVCNQSRATRSAWMLTRDAAPGTVLDAANVRSVRVADAGDQFLILQDSPLGKRLTHAMSAQALLTPADVYARDMTQVPISLRAAPSLAAGDTIDVYAVQGSRTILVGRRLVVVAGGNPLTVLVPSEDEPSWITLQANNVPLFAAKGNGVGVPSTNSVGAADAVTALSANAGSIVVPGSGKPSPATGSGGTQQAQPGGPQATPR